MNDEASYRTSSVQRPASSVKKNSYPSFRPWILDLGFWTALQALLLSLCILGYSPLIALAEEGVPVPPLEEGALFIFHPIAVHFAIALTVFGSALDCVGSVQKQREWQQAGKVCFLAGVIALGLAALTGWIEHELPRPPSAFDSHAQPLLFYHEYGGYALVGFFLVLAIFRAGIHEQLPLFFMLLSGAGLIGLLIQGYLGGELVYRYGTGVRAVQVLSAQELESGQKKAPEQSSEAEDK